jgi:hypothetical protein
MYQHGHLTDGQAEDSRHIRIEDFFHTSISRK